jgi:uncharacterized protein (TIGR02145 family)
MKPLFFLILFFASNNLLLAQDLPVVPVKPKPTATKPSTTASPKPKTKTAFTSTTVSNAPVAGTQTVKFISDASGDLYIDGEKRGRLQPNTVLRVNLRKGNYLIKVIGTGNKADELNEKYTVAETGNEFLYQLNLQAVINARLQAEAYTREQLKQKELARQNELARQKELEIQQEQERQRQLDRQKELKLQHEEYLKNITTVTIGTQVWMQRNLDVAFFRNGDPIPEVRHVDEWKRYGEQGKPCWCYYDFDPANGKIYGKLYNWYAVNDPRGLAPVGWHVSTDSDWTIFINYYGGGKNAVAAIKSKTASNNSKSDNSSSSGFSGLPGGDFSIGFFSIGVFGNWWTSTESDAGRAWSRGLNFRKGGVGRHPFEKTYGFSVRCVRD